MEESKSLFWNYLWFFFIVIGLIVKFIVNPSLGINDPYYDYDYSYGTFFEEIEYKGYSFPYPEGRVEIPMEDNQINLGSKSISKARTINSEKYIGMYQITILEGVEGYDKDKALGSFIGDLDTLIDYGGYELENGDDWTYVISENYNKIGLGGVKGNSIFIIGMGFENFDGPIMHELDFSFLYDRIKKL